MFAVKRFGFVLALLFASANTLILRAYRAPYPRPIAPALDKAMRGNYTRRVEELQPQAIFIGDSTLFYGVDVPALSAALDASIYSIALQGSASTLWYLIIKNNLMEANPPPKFLVVFFRDTTLTLPGYRVTGEYFKSLDEYATPKDTLFLERAFLNKMNPLEKAAQAYLPLYGARQELRDSLNHALRFAPARVLWQCDQTCAEAALASALNRDRRNPEALNQAVNAADENIYAPQALDFHAQVGRSFLPEIVRMTKEKNIQLILVHVKTLQTEQKFPQLDAYLQDLSIYAQNNHVIYLDYGSDPRLNDNMFWDVMHMNESGKKAFTQILTEDLAPLLH